jgi:hypothetical protein
MKFEWTDELVKEFVKVSTLGQYGEYRGMKTIGMKLTKFKKLNDMTDQQVVVKITLKAFREDFKNQIQHLTDEQVKVLCFEYHDEMSLIMSECRLTKAMEVLKKRRDEKK